MIDPKLCMNESFIYKHNLPELIGPEKWKDLARVLDFSESSVEGIQTEKNSVPRECCIAVLVRWIRKEGQRATVGKLAEALVKIELKNVADVLMGPLDDRRMISIEIRGTIVVDDDNQIILGNDRTGRSTFFVWETNTKEFFTSLKEIKDYINAIGQITRQTVTRSTFEVEDPTSKIKFSQRIDFMQKILSSITSSLEMHKLEGETYTVRKKLELISRHSKILEELYTIVTGMTSQACKCDLFVKRKFYYFMYNSLKAVHWDLKACIAGLRLAEMYMTKDECEMLQNLLADQRVRDRHVEQLEKMKKWMFSTFHRAESRAPSPGKIKKVRSMGRGTWFALCGYPLYRTSYTVQNKGQQFRAII